MTNSKAPQKRVYQIIMDQIMTQLKHHKLHPGDRLPPERKWAEELGVSRGAVREAIRALEMIGLVTIRQGGGTFINADYSLAMTQPMTISFWLGGGTVYNVHHFRQCLEQEAAYLAARHATADDIATLQRLADAMAHEPDSVKSAAIDRRFHDTIAIISGNGLIHDALASVGSLLDDILYESLVAIISEEQGEGVLAFQHSLLVDAIAAGNPDLALKRMKEHMLYVEDFLSDLTDLFTTSTIQLK